MPDTRITGSMTTRQWELAAYAVELRRDKLNARVRQGDHGARSLAEEYDALSTELRRINAAVRRELATA